MPALSHSKSRLNFHRYFLSLFVTNIPNFFCSKVFWDNSISLSQSENRIIWLTLPVNGLTESVAFKLAIKPACDPVNLSYSDLDGYVVLGTNDVVAHGAFPQHVQVHKLYGAFCMLRPCLLSGLVSTESCYICFKHLTCNCKNLWDWEWQFKHALSCDTVEVTSPVQPFWYPLSNVYPLSHSTSWPLVTKSLLFTLVQVFRSHI